MKTWPVPNSFNPKIPKSGNKGSFWEERSGMFNCGVDIGCPEGSIVVSIDEGIVIDIGVFSDPINEHYFNKSYYVTVKSPEKINYKYASLASISVEIGERIKPGSLLGRVGKIIDENKLDADTPFHIREAFYNDEDAKMHLELYKAPIMEVRPYEIGNYLGEEKPKSILDPNVYLMGLTRTEDIYKL